MLSWTSHSADRHIRLSLSSDLVLQRTAGTPAPGHRGHVLRRRHHGPQRDGIVLRGCDQHELHDQISGKAGVPQLSSQEQPLRAEDEDQREEDQRVLQEKGRRREEEERR